LVRRPIIVLRFSAEAWRKLREANDKVDEFTFAKEHSLLQSIKAPVTCLIVAGQSDKEKIYFGLITSLCTISTFDTKVKVKQAFKVQPGSKKELYELLIEEDFF